jgi:hypothetical protein
MSKVSYINGKKAEKIVEKRLKEIGCFINQRDKLVKLYQMALKKGETVKAEYFNRFPFVLDSQVRLHKRESNFRSSEAFKIADFADYYLNIEVKSISEKTVNVKKANEELIGRLVVELKKYSEYITEKFSCREKYKIYYILLGPCDKEMIISYLKDFRCWYELEEHLHLLTLDEMTEMFKQKINDHKLKYDLIA